MPEGGHEAPALAPRQNEAEVLRRLEADIIFGAIGPGARLIEDVLMARYGATRHFVRQALVQLERQGIVRREKNVGATVRRFTGEEVRQIYEVREMLTRQAALMIPLPACDALLQELEALQARYRAAIERRHLRDIHDANDAFHIAFFAACRNPYLVLLLQDYMNLTLPMRAKNLANPEGLRLSCIQHDMLISLLRGRDPWALAQLCIEHMQFSKLDYLSAFGTEETGPA